MRTLVALVLLAAGAAAQTVKWGIPERGVVFYRRDLSVTPRSVASRARDWGFQARQTTGFQQVLMPPVLLEGELDARKQYVELPPDDLREVAAWLAFDLRRARSRGRVRRVIPFLMGIGAVHIKGKWHSPDDDGVQTLKAIVSREQTERGDIPPRVYEGHYNNWQQLNLEGEIEISRKVDRDKGLVTWFRSTFRGKLSVREDAEPPPGRGGPGAGRGGRGGPGAGRGGRGGPGGGRGGGPGGGRGGGRGGREGRGGGGDRGWGAGADNTSFTIEETWTFDAVKENRYPGFRARVAEAIRSGAEYVKRSIQDPSAGQFNPDGDDAGRRGGRGGFMGPSGQRSYSSGRLALCLLTLVKAGVDRKDPVVVEGFRELRRRVLVDSYSLGLALMAMEALHAPDHERQALIEGRLKAPSKRNVALADLKLMQEWTDKLLKNTDACADVRRGYLLRFNYVPNMERYDNSNTQYALLGLYSAHLCGVKISPSRWFANAQHWIKDQDQDRRASVPLRLVTHREYFRSVAARDASSSSTRTFTGGRKVPIAGWPYINVRPVTQDVRRSPRGPGQRANPLTGSMTTAGVTGVTICEAVLFGQRKGMELVGKLRDAKERGFAWLLRSFTVRSNRNHHGQYYYYMYGLERACELSQVRLLGNRDWYFEGATMLLELQQGRGQFRGGAIHDTCFAILFLKLASPPLPVITQR